MPAIKTNFVTTKIFFMLLLCIRLPIPSKETTPLWVIYFPFNARCPFSAGKKYLVAWWPVRSVGAIFNFTSKTEFIKNHMVNGFQLWSPTLFWVFLTEWALFITSSGREMMTGDIDITYSQLTSFKHFEGTAMVRIHRVAGPACPVYGLGNIQMLAWK